MTIIIIVMCHSTYFEKNIGNWDCVTLLSIFIIRISIFCTFSNFLPKHFHQKSTLFTNKNRILSLWRMEKVGRNKKMTKINRLDYIDIVMLCYVTTILCKVFFNHQTDFTFQECFTLLYSHFILFQKERVSEEA